MLYEADPVTITIGDESSESKSMLDDIRALQPIVTSTDKDDDIAPMILSNHKSKPKPKKEKKKKKKSSSLLTLSDDSDFIVLDNEEAAIDDTNRLLDAESVILDHIGGDESDDIVKTGKRGYKKLKKDTNAYKKEFAEEITLLYSLLDETTQYGKDLEKDLKSIRSSKVRGVSKYSNDLASLVLTAKQTKLNILKEISSVKKSIVDLGIKENKNNNKNDGGMSSESLASQYFKNILSHGRTEFIDRVSGGDDPHDLAIADFEDSYSDKEEDEYLKVMEERLTYSPNPFRSEAGSKYIEYEQRGVNVYVKKCIDTGDWHFIAIDKVGQIVDDYPLPDRRTVGRMKFTDDGEYATDAAGRMYKVIEYYLPSSEYDDDDDDDE